MMHGETHERTIEETRAKLRAAKAGKKWFNDGTSNYFGKEPPGEEWVRGKVKSKK